jgi:pimeloyl-ACP methyl ester carboxylesterase
LFCHAISADGAGFSNAIPPLEAEGREVIAAQYGLDTNEATSVGAGWCEGVRIRNQTVGVDLNYKGEVMKEHIKNVVLVHGAFADGSGWEAVANILKNDGYKVSVVQHPETSYAEDQKYTKAAIDALDGPVVLVGHSYGGSVITEAGNHPKVAALVYIAAFALDTGESCATIEQGLPQASKAFKPDSNGNWWIEQEHFAADFAADLPQDKAAFMAVSQVPISTDSFTHKVTSPAWKTKPTWYMVAAADRSINPDQERMMAKRANAKTVEVNSSHVAYMSHAKETAKLIEEAATSAPVNQ